MGAALIMSTMSASDPLIGQLDGHIDVTRRVGSPFYAVLLERMRADAADVTLEWVDP
jgi:hypothetical protein